MAARVTGPLQSEDDVTDNKMQQTELSVYLWSTTNQSRGLNPTVHLHILIILPCVPNVDCWCFFSSIMMVCLTCTAVILLIAPVNNNQPLEMNFSPLHFSLNFWRELTTSVNKSSKCLRATPKNGHTVKWVFQSTVVVYRGQGGWGEIHQFNQKLILDLVPFSDLLQCFFF